MLLPEGAHELKYLAMTDDAVGQGVLSALASNLYRSIETHLSKQAAAGANPARIWRIIACLRKLDAVLLQARRMRGHHDALISAADTARAQVPAEAWLRTLGDPKPPPSFAIRGDDVCSDFEALLLQTRAALDRLTFFVAPEYKQPKLDIWYKLPNVLADFAPRDARASAVLDLFGVDFWQRGIYRNLSDGTTSLRSYVAHRGTIAESISTYFAVSYLDPLRALVIDCESRGHPIFRTSWETAKYLPHLLLNTLAILTTGESLALDAFHPDWKLRSVVVTDFEGPGATARIMVVSRMAPDSVSMTIRGVQPSIAGHAISLPPRY